MSAPADSYQQAMAHARAGRFDAAIAAADEAAAADPANSAALALKAALLLQAGQAEAAVATCDAALARDPQDGRLHTNRADALARLERLDEALQAYDRAIALEPSVAALVNRANLLADMNRPTDALASCDAAAQLDPTIPAVHSNRARALMLLDRYEEALAAAEQALALKPDHVRAWINRGDALKSLRRYETACACYRAALRIDPGHVHALTSLGIALRFLALYGDAIAAFDAGERSGREGAATAVFQRSLVKLLVGDFEGGWRDMRSRWQSPEFLVTASGFVTPRVRTALTVPLTRADLEGKRVTLVSEQGIGDQLMFLSMLPDLLQVAASVACVCERRLIGLLSESFPQVRFFDSREGPPKNLAAADLYVASGDLGQVFRNRPEDFPSAPFVRANPGAARAWGERLGTKRGKLRVGLSWRGGTKITDAEARSIPLSNLSRLLALPGCEFVSLQYGDVAAEIAEAGGGMRSFEKAEIDDFGVLAALVENLDLVVSVQTAIVHLSGALGKPCYTMVPVRPEWRYMTAGERLPWYGSVRIFRQDATESWAPVVEQVTRAVARAAAGG